MVLKAGLKSTNRILCIGFSDVQVLEGEVEGHVDDATASSTDLLVDRLQGVMSWSVMFLRWDSTRHSKDFISTQVRATGLSSAIMCFFGPVYFDGLG